ncbi:MAG: hypothetical protein ACK2UW_10990 [Anaerolineales bacterium]|jgi:hypothetical protein
MPKFLVEVPHDEDRMACIQAIQAFVETGSHFLANAEWGCEDGEHKAWIIVDVEDKATARAIVPPNYRHNTSIVRLTRYSQRQVDKMLGDHQDEA